jgi:glycosyltransferase involved in cell wall biosynthesis
MNKFIFFTESVSRKSGGSSSVLDLSNNIYLLNKKVEIYSILGKLDLFLYRPSSFNKNIKINVINYKIINDLEIKPHIIKQKVNLLFNKFKKEIEIKNSIIFDAIRLPEWYIDKLKKNNNKIILNHAGSPNAFIKYFGMNGEERIDYEKAKNDYLDFIKKYDLFWFQSSTQAEKFIKLTKIEEKRIIVLTPGANERDIENAKYINLSNKFNVVIVGSVHKRKGQHFIVDIAKNLPDVYFHIVGNIVSEIYYKNILNKLKKENIKNVTFYGFRKDYLNFIKSADLILQLSEEEGVSRILRETMALGKPIVAFNLDGTGDLLKNGEDSILIKYGNIDAIIEIIKKLKNDKNLKEKLALNAKKNYLNKYHSSVYLKKLERVLKEIYG